MLSIPGKIPIRIYPFFWFVAFAIGWLNSYASISSLNGKIIGTLVWVIIIVISIIIHEFGHALTSLAFGQKASIDLIGVGGVTHRVGKKLKLWQEFIVVFNGPLFGFLLAFLSIMLRSAIGEETPQIFIFAVNIAIYVNIFWTIINLLPIQPLDGGHLLRIVLEAFFGLKGVKIALFLSILLSAIITVAFLAIREVIAGSIFLILTYESYRSWRNSLSISTLDQDEKVQMLLKEAEREMRLGDRKMAISKLEHVLEVAKSGVINALAAQYLAKLLYEEGKYKQAYAMLAPLNKQLGPDAIKLLHQLAYLCGEFETAISLGDRSYQYEPIYETALINALCYSLLGQAKPAVGWLNCAIRDGMPNLRAILSKKEFDGIRQSSFFQDLQKKAHQ